MDNYFLYLSQSRKVAKVLLSEFHSFNIVFTQLPSDNPFDLGYIEKMKSYDDKYKIRVGNYRIGITLDKQTKTVTCRRIAHIREIYRIFP